MPDDKQRTDGPLESLYAPEYFALLAGHHLRLSDRSGSPAVFVFVRVDGAGPTTDPVRAAEHAAEIVLDSVRSSDVPTMIDDRTFAILLTGDASGAEEQVLSRIVEAIAERRGADPSGDDLALSVGTAVYEPGSGVALDAIIEGAVRRMSSDDR